MWSEHSTRALSKPIPKSVVLSPAMVSTKIQKMMKHKSSLRPRFELIADYIMNLHRITIRRWNCTSYKYKRRPQCMKYFILYVACVGQNSMNLR